MHKNNEISFVKKKETTKKTQNINPTNNRREQLYAPISTSSSRIYFQGRIIFFHGKSEMREFEHHRVYLQGLKSQKSCVYRLWEMYV